MSCPFYKTLPDILSKLDILINEIILLTVRNPDK